MRISDCSSDVCSSDLLFHQAGGCIRRCRGTERSPPLRTISAAFPMAAYAELLLGEVARYTVVWERIIRPSGIPIELIAWKQLLAMTSAVGLARPTSYAARITSLLAMKSGRSEEHTSELQSLMRISYAVF